MKRLAALMLALPLLGCGKSVNSPSVSVHWAPTNGPPGEVTCLLTRDGRVFAGTTSGGLFRSNDGGIDWVPTVPTSFYANHVYALGAGTHSVLAFISTVIRSVDHGATWTPAPTSTAWFVGGRISWQGRMWACGAP